MERLAPFEAHPAIMVAVSGGADSLALLHLMAEWATMAEGSVLAVTVDHALRAASGEEAERVAAWCAGLGVRHLILKWADPRPEHGAVQDRARQARYALLSEAAGDRGILHIATAHHADDQVETVLLRLCKGSGVDGMAGMAAETWLAHARLIRPLLLVPSARLRATCAARSQEWIDDPSNLSRKFARARLRQALPSLENEGLSAESVLATAGRMAGARICLEEATAALLAHAATIYPQAYAELALPVWSEAPRELALRALGQVIQTIGNSPYPPRHEKLEALYHRIAEAGFTTATLGDCLIECHGDTLHIMGENRFPPPDLALSTGCTERWGSFNVWANYDVRVGFPPPCSSYRAQGSLPAHVAACQPSFYDEQGLAAIPTLGFYRDESAKDSFKAVFTPAQPLAKAIFAIVSPPRDIILTSGS